MMSEDKIKKRFEVVNPMSIECHSNENEEYLRGYSDALEWVLELK
jgi:hypothetical protein